MMEPGRKESRGAWRFLRTGLMLLAVGQLWACATPSAQAESDSSRIVVIGDLHGDFEKFVSVMRTAGLIDQSQHWSGGSARLVQMGDVPDRGPDSRKILDLLMELEGEAANAGGWIDILIGNHEAMNVIGDLRYVSAGEFEAFQTHESRALRDKLYQASLEWMRETWPPEELPEFDDAFRDQWYAEHPLGYVEHRRAWAPTGQYGSWVIQHDAVLKIGDTLFVHGGIGPSFLNQTIDGMNNAVRAALAQGEQVGNDTILTAEDGPLWYRGLAQHNETTEAAHVDALLARYGVVRIVIAHTPVAGTVLPRFGGKVIIVDVGLSSVYGGRNAFLVIENGVPYTVHRGHRLDLPTDGTEALRTYLSAAAALDPSPSPLLATIAALDSAGAGLDAEIEDLPEN